MNETVAIWFWRCAGVYAAFGLCFAVPFVARWAGRMDPMARSGTIGFRMLILPGAAALWPFLLVKLLRCPGQAEAPPADPERPVAPATQRLLHGMAFLTMAIVVPIAAISALVTRPADLRSTARMLDQVPLERVVPIVEGNLKNLPGSVRLRTDGARHQLEIAFSAPLPEPIIGVYWTPQVGKEGVGERTVFLGSVWGPARHLFAVPAIGGTLQFHALAGTPKIFETIDLGR